MLSIVSRTSVRSRSVRCGYLSAFIATFFVQHLVSFALFFSFSALCLLSQDKIDTVVTNQLPYLTCSSNRKISNNSTDINSIHAMCNNSSRLY